MYSSLLARVRVIQTMSGLPAVFITATILPGDNLDPRYVVIVAFSFSFLFSGTLVEHPERQSVNPASLGRPQS